MSELKNFYIDAVNIEEDIARLRKICKFSLGDTATESAMPLQKPDAIHATLWKRASVGTKIDYVAVDQACQSAMVPVRSVVSEYSTCGAAILLDRRAGTKIQGSAELMVRLPEAAERLIRSMPKVRIVEAAEIA
jgi:hypothetical protein